MTSLGLGANAKLRNCPDLQPLMLHTVAFTGKTLGCGSYGSVEEVEVTGALCAAKKIHDFLTKEDPKWLAKEVADGNIQKFISECKMMSRLRHPNIVQFLGIWVSHAENSSLYLIMEKMLMSLHDLLVPDDKHKSSSPSKSSILLGLKCSILQDIARGMAFLHKQKPPVIHRDLSARNILLDSAMVAKIADMGMARILPGLDTIMTKQPGACVYMPPEALDDKYDASIDMFSLGVVALFVLTQEFPKILKSATYTDPVKGLVARTELERREKYTALITFPKSHPLVQLIESCLQNRPEDRPSIDRALELLAHAVEGVKDSTSANLSMSKLQLIELIQQQKKRFQLQMESMQQKCDTCREKAEKLTPLGDQVDEKVLRITRLQATKEMVGNQTDSDQNKKLTEREEQGYHHSEADTSAPPSLPRRSAPPPVPPRKSVTKKERNNNGSEANTSAPSSVSSKRMSLPPLPGQKDYHDNEAKTSSLPSVSPKKTPLPKREESTVKPHEKMDTWYKDNLTRDKAVELLRGSADGTFLCRPSSKQSPLPGRRGLHTHTIDVASDGGVNHYSVSSSCNSQYRLSKLDASFTSIKDMVLHYSTERTEPNSPKITLKFPRFNQE